MFGLYGKGEPEKVIAGVVISRKYGRQSGCSSPTVPNEFYAYTVAETNPLRRTIGSENLLLGHTFFTTKSFRP